MRFAAGLSLCLISALSTTARADRFGLEHYETPAARARAGADVTLFEDSPTNAALDRRSGVEGVRLEARATLSEGANGLRALRRLEGLDLTGAADPNTELMRLIQQIEEAREIAGGSGLDVSGRARVTFAVTRLDRPWGNLQFGPYLQLGVAGVADLPEEMRTENLQLDAQGPFLALGRDRRLVTAQGLAETGGRVAYGRVFSLARGRRAALGAQLRGFGLMRTTRHELWARAVVRGMEDVRRPEQFDYRFGFGFGLDTFAALDFDDRWLGARVGARLEDTASFVMVGEAVDLRMPRLGVGTHLRPLRALGEERALVAIDLERIETGAPSLQLGVLFDSNGSLAPSALAQRNSAVGVRPALGLSVHERDLFGDAFGARITGGIGVSAGVFHCDLSAEYEPARQLFDLGLSIGLGP